MQHADLGGILGADRIINASCVFRQNTNKQEFVVPPRAERESKKEM